MARSAKLFTTIRNYLMVDERLLLPKLEDSVSNKKDTQILNSTRAIQKKIIATLDSLVFIHVDEPNDEYLQHLKDLQAQINEEQNNTVESVYPMACDTLSDEEQAELKREAQKLIA